MCGLEFPDIESRIWRRYKDQGVVVLGVSGGGLFGKENRDTVTHFVDQTKITFPVVLADQSRRAYARRDEMISPFPFDVVLDASGTIRYMGTKFDSAQMARVIDDLLANR